MRSHLGKNEALQPLRAFQDQVLKPALSSIPGVAEVASLGRNTNEVLVETTPEQLNAAGVALSDLVASLRSTLTLAPPTVAQLEALRASPARRAGVCQGLPLSAIACACAWRRQWPAAWPTLTARRPWSAGS